MSEYLYLLRNPSTNEFLYDIKYLNYATEKLSFRYSKVKNDCYLTKDKIAKFFIIADDFLRGVENSELLSESFSVSRSAKQLKKSNDEKREIIKNFFRHEILPFKIVSLNQDQHHLDELIPSVNKIRANNHFKNSIGTYHQVHRPRQFAEILEQWKALKNKEELSHIIKIDSDNTEVKSWWTEHLAKIGLTGHIQNHKDMTYAILSEEDLNFFMITSGWDTGINDFSIIKIQDLLQIEKESYNKYQVVPD